MGKVRKLRQKYQASLGKDGKEKGSLYFKHSSGTRQSFRVVKKKAIGGLKASDRFTGFHIKFREAFGNQDKSDRVSVSFNQQKKSGSKNDRRRQKHEELMKKIDVIQVVEKAEKERKKREKTVIVGDMHPILDALPSVEELASTSSKMDAQTSKNDQKTKEQRQTHEDYLSNIWMFMKAHQDPIYKQDPFGTVAEAVKNRVLNDS